MCCQASRYTSAFWSGMKQAPRAAEFAFPWCVEISPSHRMPLEEVLNQIRSTTSTMPKCDHLTDGFPPLITEKISILLYIFEKNML